MVWFGLYQKDIKEEIGEKIRVFFLSRAMERSDPPAPKRQKTEEEATRYNGCPDDDFDFDSDECSDGEIELFDQEMERSGGVGDFVVFLFWILSFFLIFFAEIDFFFLIVRVMKSTSRNFATVLAGDHFIWMMSHSLAILKPTDISSLSWLTLLSTSTTKIM